MDAPINRRKIRAISERARQRLGRLTDDEWENVVGLSLQLVSNSEFMELLDGLQAVDETRREELTRAVGVLRSNKALERVVAVDKVLDRGPRLRHLSCSCDVRVHFADTQSTGADAAAVTQEEFRLPIVIVRMRVDELPQYVYFQASASELKDHISTLQRAYDQLRCLGEKEGA